MAEPFKNWLHRGLVGHAAHRLHRAWPGFDEARFIALGADGLEALELKARALQITQALHQTLPADFDTAVGLIETVLQGDDGLQGWVLWPFGEYIAQAGQAQPERALQALHALTQRFTAEFAIRPFIVNHPALTYATLARWATDPSEHVRRLVSEGSRPRLPWGLQLKAQIADPSPGLPLLAALQDDPSEYVRRSVANHLNDIAKDHPTRVAQWLEEHLPAAPAERRALLRHASRTLIKQGHPRVLAAWGLGQAYEGRLNWAVSPGAIRLGDSLQLSLQLQSSSRQAQDLVVDYVVQHVKADGSRTPKVFKGWKLTLSAGAEAQLVKRHTIKPITTRRYHAGLHRVEVQINGRVLAGADFELRLG